MLAPPCFRVEIDAYVGAYADDLLDVAAGDAALQLAYETRRTPARLGKLDLREAELASPGTDKLTEVTCVSESAIGVARLWRKKGIHVRLPVTVSLLFMVGYLPKRDYIRGIKGNHTVWEDLLVGA
ncbi:MAG: hypothetical protein Q4C41_00915 [Eggerthellaceae bacterium]|nr:hypothetical protein [Eggerthellaceae bacterium]